MHPLLYAFATIYGLSFIRAEMEDKDLDAERNQSTRKQKLHDAAYGPDPSLKARGRLTGPSYGDFSTPVPYLRDDGMDVRSYDRVGGYRTGRNELSYLWGKVKFNQDSMFLTEPANYSKQRQ